MIRFKRLAILFVLAVCATSALADIHLVIEEPAEQSTKSGIGQIAGWAVSDNEIVSVEALIDGSSLGIVPYGGTRQDVAAAFPTLADAEFSGWAMKWNYSLLEPGEHLLTIIVTDAQGARFSSDVLFSTTAFSQAFIADTDSVKTAGTFIDSPEDGLIVIAGAEVDGEVVDIELLWDTPSQQFLISDILRDEPTPPNQAPVANAGPDLSVQTNETLQITGNGSDSDGNIRAWRWQQVSGNPLTLQNTRFRTVWVTAPPNSGEARLRLTITDDDGATDTDDVIITVQSPPEPDNTTGEPVPSMLAVINAARGQEQDCGGEIFPAQDPLLWSDSLADIARLHAMDMARQGYFDHTSRDGTSMGDRVFPYWDGNRLGENIAASSIPRSDSFVVDLWLNSPGHCVLIMDPDFTHAGIGAGHDIDNGYDFHHFWTLDFGG